MGKFIIILLFGLISLINTSCKNEKKKERIFNTDIHGRLVPLMILNIEEIESKYKSSISIEKIDSLSYIKAHRSDSVNNKINNVIILDSNESYGLKSLLFALKFLDSIALSQGKPSRFIFKDFKTDKMCHRVDSSNFYVLADNKKKVYFSDIKKPVEFGSTVYEFNYFGSSLNSYSVLKEFGNGGVFSILVNKSNGDKTEIWGEDFPILLENYKKFATVSNSGPTTDNPIGFQIYTYNDNTKINKELEVQFHPNSPEPVGLVWESNNTIVIDLVSDLPTLSNHSYYRIKFDPK
jgi:hypothetical protein